MPEPTVSVVMGVYNGLATLPATLASVLDQQGCDFEFIVVDDGSTDGSSQVLDEWAARDPRLHVIHQPNTGLTRALIRGCAQARGEFIARQDCGDRSLPGRLAGQVECFRRDPQLVLLGGGARFLGPRGEPLFSVLADGERLEAGLSAIEAGELKGPPHHGATMFKRTAYERVGGYRALFVVAQDIDLWLRLAEAGRCAGQSEVVYDAQLDARSITSRRREEQVDLAALARECARRRRSGSSDESLVVMSSAGPRAHRPAKRKDRLADARFLYFVGSCLRSTDPRAARRYFWEAFRTHPLMVKSLVRLALP